MRKALITIIIFLALPLFADISYDTIPVEFTSNITHYAGFSRNRVSGTIKPAKQDTLPYSENSETLVFKTIDTDSMNYTTDQFFFFMQIFDSDPVEVNIISADPLKLSGNESITLNYTNSSSDTSGQFSGSSSSLPAQIFSESGTNLRPRVYNFGFKFNVGINDIKSAGTYEGSIKFEVKSK